MKRNNNMVYARFIYRIEFKYVFSNINRERHSLNKNIIIKIKVVIISTIKHQLLL
jgi:hypothetical protein